MPIDENQINEDACPYCLGFRYVSMLKPILIIGNYRIVKEIKEPCAYCNLIKINSSEFEFLNSSFFYS